MDDVEYQYRFYRNSMKDDGRETVAHCDGMQVLIHCVYNMAKADKGAKHDSLSILR